MLLSPSAPAIGTTPGATQSQSLISSGGGTGFAERLQESSDAARHSGTDSPNDNSNINTVSRRPDRRATEKTSLQPVRIESPAAITTPVTAQLPQPHVGASQVTSQTAVPPVPGSDSGIVDSNMSGADVQVAPPTGTPAPYPLTTVGIGAADVKKQPLPGPAPLACISAEAVPGSPSTEDLAFAARMQPNGASTATVPGVVSGAMSGMISSMSGVSEPADPQQVSGQQRVDSIPSIPGIDATRNAASLFGKGTLTASPRIVSDAPAVQPPDKANETTANPAHAQGAEVRDKEKGTQKKSTPVEAPEQTLEPAAKSASFAGPAVDPSIRERPGTAPTERTHSAAAPPEIENPQADPPSGPATPMKELSLRVEAPEGQRVDVNITQRAGDLRVAVRTADRDIVQSLRQGLSELTSRLADSGFRAETWRPAHSGTVADSSPEMRNTSNQSSQGDAQSNSSWSQQDRDQRQNNPNRPRWVEELESTFTAAAASKGQSHGLTS